MVGIVVDEDDERVVAGNALSSPELRCKESEHRTPASVKYKGRRWGRANNEDPIGERPGVGRCEKPGLAWLIGDFDDDSR